MNDLLDYIAPRAGDAVAARYVQRIYRYCLGFDLFPERGIGRNADEPGLRIVGFRRQASIAFTVTPEAVTIVRVFHHGRQIRLD